MVPPGGGTPIIPPMGGEGTIKAHTRNTNGSLTVFEFLVPPKQGPGLHIHEREDEIWYVLEGEFRFKAGEDMFWASAGSFVFGPRGVPHAFQNVGDTPGRFVAVCTPSGAERFFEQLADHGPTVDQDTFTDIAHGNWLQFVGPRLAISDPL
jgi:mannose-6-phosphate isomerase-like protein (cupin superfamily)